MSPYGAANHGRGARTRSRRQLLLCSASFATPSSLLSIRTSTRSLYQLTHIVPFRRGVFPVRRPTDLDTTSSYFPIRSKRIAE